MIGTFEILCGIAALCLAIYYYFTANLDFWKVRGVAGPKPVPLFGNVLEVLLGKRSMGLYLKDIYDTYKDEKLIGIFLRTKPIVILRDPDLIKDVLIKDFSKFSDRGINVVDKVEPLSQHLFSLEPERWRPLRTKLSPVFTSGKIKEMFPLIVECSEHLRKHLGQLASKDEPIDCRELMARYTTNVIGSCAFGIEMNALEDEDCNFRRMGRKIFAPSYLNLLKARMRETFPKVYNKLACFFYNKEMTEFFSRTVTDTIAYRRKNSIVRHDFINLLMGLLDNPDQLDIELTDTLVAAQAFVFFAAGFETSASTLCNAMYELALYPDIQEKLRAEILGFLEDTNGEFTYDGVKSLKYLDMVFKETLRKYPIVMVLMRRSVAPYTFKDTKVSIPKGTNVWIPCLGIQRDPEIYPNPDAFEPERFSEENIKNRHPMYHLPFGDGPRNCIGARFAVHQTKIGLIQVLRDYKIVVCEKTDVPYVIEPKTFLLAPKNGIYLKLSKLNDSGKESHCNGKI